MTQPTPEDLALNVPAKLAELTKELKDARPEDYEGTDAVAMMQLTASLCRRLITTEEQAVHFRAGWRQLVAVVEMTVADGHAMQGLSKILTQIIYKK